MDKQDKIIWEEIEGEYEEYLNLFKKNDDSVGFLLFLILKELRK